MIDDSYYNYERLVNNGINAILFDEHNRYQSINKRISNWNELIDVFNLPDSPIDNFKNAIAKEFKVYEKLDDERIDVKVIPFDDNYNVTVILTNNDTGEKRDFNKCFICDMNNDITYANAGELGYKFAHSILNEINS